MTPRNERVGTPDQAIPAGASMNYLTYDDILELHTFAVERYGGRLGIRSQDRFQDIVAAPRLMLFGVELYPDLASKAGVIGFMLLKNRPFNSANETTTLLVLLRLLAINGIEWDTSFPHKLASALQGVLDSEWSQEIFTHWLRDECTVQMKT